MADMQILNVAELVNEYEEWRINDLHEWFPVKLLDRIRITTPLPNNNYGNDSYAVTCLNQLTTCWRGCGK
jgi:hypothetical protein